MAKKKNRKPAAMSDKERRREARRVEKQIAQGKRKIRLNDGRIINGKQIKAMRTAGSEIRQYYARVEQYLSVAFFLTIATRVFTASDIPGGFRMLVFLLCVPICLGFQVLLTALVPTESSQNRIVRECGGNLFNSLASLVFTIESTKFVQFVLQTINGPDVPLLQRGNSDDVLNVNDLDENGEFSKDWKPAPPKPSLYKMSAQNGLTKMFLYGIPYIFGGAAVLLLLVGFLRTTSRDPTFGGSNLRAVRFILPLCFIVSGAFVTSTLLVYFNSTHWWLHPLYTPVLIIIIFIVSRNFTPSQRAAIKKQFEQFKQENVQQ
jgi:hypothetical protein